ncbi:MAG: hypothetical protein AABY07_00800 [Nanoarchaeota archaeon]
MKKKGYEFYNLPNGEIELLKDNRFNIRRSNKLAAVLDYAVNGERRDMDTERRKK